MNKRKYNTMLCALVQPIGSNGSPIPQQRIIDKLHEYEQRITDLEQQLKTAKVDTVKEVSELLSDVTVDGNIFDALGKYQPQQGKDHEHV